MKSSFSLSNTNDRRLQAIDVTSFYMLAGQQLKITRQAAKRLLLLAQREGLIKICWHADRGAYFVPTNLEGATKHKIREALAQ